MIKQSLFFLTALPILSACNLGSPSENSVDLSVVFKVNTNSPLVNSNRLTMRFGREMTWTDKPDKFIKSGNADGWSGKFKFPSSGILTGVACQFPGLVGFTDVDMSDGPDVVKTINLVKAEVIGMQVLEPRDGEYLQKEFSMMPNSEFQIDADEISELCSVKFSHSPNVDFMPYFSIQGDKISMKNTRLNMFEKDLSNPSVDMTTVTIMGVVNIDGKRQGFTATAEIEVSKSY